MYLTVSSSFLTSVVMGGGGAVRPEVIAGKKKLKICVAAFWIRLRQAMP
jgi:hypothetical protein